MLRSGLAGGQKDNLAADLFHRLSGDINLAPTLFCARMLSELDHSDNTDLQRIQKATWGKLGYTAN